MLGELWDEFLEGFYSTLKDTPGCVAHIAGFFSAIIFCALGFIGFISLIIFLITRIF